MGPDADWIVQVDADAIVQDGRFVRWAGQELHPSLHEIRCCAAAHEPAEFEALLNESEGSDLVFRRERSIRLPLVEAFPVTEIGLPILAPQLVLHYNANRKDDESNQRDLLNAARHLDAFQLQWLRGALRTLHSDHQWLHLIEE